MKKNKKKIQQTIKTIKQSMNKIHKIWFGCTLFVLALTSCGTTRVSVDKPSQGTQTTITVTTNNPITTNTNPTIEIKK